MKTVYCIALEGNAITGSEWRASKADRDAILGTLGAEIEICFELEVPNNATPEQITNLVDEAAWLQTYNAGKEL